VHQEGAFHAGDSSREGIGAFEIANRDLNTIAPMRHFSRIAREHPHLLPSR
jgi:hypothetical protein